MFTITKNTTKQELFDETVRHLKEQKYRAHDGKQCLYRFSPSENIVHQCALGNLIPDSEYTEDMEGKLGASLLSNYETCLNKLSFDNPGQFLTDLQSAHDCTYPSWRDTLHLCAVNHGLDFDWDEFPEDLPLGNSIELGSD